MSSDEIYYLIEDSSLGSVAARRLRARTSPDDAARVKELERLTTAVRDGQWWELGELARMHQQMGNLQHAEDLLRRLASTCLTEIAALRRARGDRQGEQTWAARAKTLEREGERKTSPAAGSAQRRTELPARRTPSGRPSPSAGTKDPLTAASLAARPRSKGTVKWFNAEKGYGFIAQDDGGADIFVHYSAIDTQGYRTLEEGDVVVFETKEGPQGPQALTVRPGGEAPS